LCAGLHERSRKRHCFLELRVWKPAFVFQSGKPSWMADNDPSGHQSSPQFRCQKPLFFNLRPWKGRQGAQWWVWGQGADQPEVVIVQWTRPSRSHELPPGGRLVDEVQQGSLPGGPPSRSRSQVRQKRPPTPNTFLQVCHILQTGETIAAWPHRHFHCCSVLKSAKCLSQAEM
jgi:hypothetical protein